MNMVKRMAVVGVLGVCWVLGGCGKSGPSSDYKKNAEPVVAALEKVKADAGSNPPAKTFAADLAAAQKTYDAWYGSLKEDDKQNDATKVIQFAMTAYTQLNNDITRGAKPKPAAATVANDSVTQARALLNGTTK